jgi:hypothetical protein
MVSVYLVFGAVEAGFVNLWIVGYAVMLLLWGQRGEALVVPHAVRWCTTAAMCRLPHFHPVRRGALGAR